MQNYKHIELIEQDEESKLQRGESNQLPSRTDLETKASSFHGKKNTRYFENSFFNDEESLLEEYESKKYETFPKMPIKAILLAVFLLIAGLGFIGMGISSFVNDLGNEKIFTYLLFGIFLSIPGCYYNVFLWQAFRAETPYEREQMLNEIPL